MLSVAEIMTREPYTLAPEASLADARCLMAEHHIRHVPILSPDGALIGVVSQRDVLAASASNLAGTGTQGKDSNPPLSELMTAPVQTVEPSTDLRGAALFLQKNRLGCLPVLSEGKLVGIVTDSDYVGVAINLMEQLELNEPMEEDDFPEDAADY